jgi:small-conductance mechanosensitive channel
MWVQSRQFTGRIVTVSNAQVFDEPIYNYTRRFPYIWEEMRVPIRYGDDRVRAESILIDAARKHTAEIARIGVDDLKELQRRYDLPSARIEPRVYWRLTDNWVEMTLRFLARDHGTREVKDAISRDILAAFDEAGLQIASATYEIVGVPKLTFETSNGGKGAAATPASSGC